MLLTAGARLGPYEIRSLLGSGGGIVAIYDFGQDASQPYISMELID